MTNELARRRRCSGIAFALGLTLAAGAAHAQTPPTAGPPPSGVAYPLPSGAAYPLTGAADADPENFVIRTDVEGLSLLPAGARANNVPELLASERTRQVLAGEAASAGGSSCSIPRPR